MGCIPGNVTPQQFKATSNYTPTETKKHSVDNPEPQSVTIDNHGYEPQNKKIDRPHTVLRKVDGKLIKTTIDYP